MGIQDLGDNVRRLMKVRSLTIPELSGKMGMGTASLSNLLNGKTEPKSSTLLKLADGLEVPFKDLLADAPRLSSLRFRSAKTLSGREKAERDQLRHDTARWIEAYSELERLLAKELPYRLESTMTTGVVEAVEAVRSALGLEPDEPIYDISGLMEKAGVKLRIRSFGFRKAFGLSLGRQDGGPAIVVNSEPGVSVERQIFTIAHELGHLVLHQNSYAADSEHENDQEENDANLFAGLFLIPEQGLIREWSNSKGLHWVDRVLRAKKYFKVSYKTILYRLKQIDPLLRDRLLERDFAIAYRQLHGHDLKDHYEPNALESLVATKDPDALGENDLVEDRYSRLVREAYDAELISLGRAGEMLGRSLEEIRSLALAWQEI